MDSDPSDYEEDDNYEEEEEVHENEPLWDYAKVRKF